MIMKTFIITIPNSNRVSIVKRVGTALSAKIVYSIPGDIVRGCATGHKMALEMSLGISPVLILEDDADFTPYYTDINFSSFVFPSDADAVYLGLSKYGYLEDASLAKYVDVDEHFVKLETMLATHSILYLSERYKQHSLELMEQSLETNFPVDVLLARAMREYNVYALKRPIFYQNCEKHKWATLIKIK